MKLTKHLSQTNGRFVLLLPVVLTAFFSSPLHANPVLDQQQLLYNGGMSARTLPGYSLSQTFTAGLSGVLTEIDMGFFAAYRSPGKYATWDGFGQLSITDATGALLETERVRAFTIAGPFTWNNWATDVNVLRGHQYAFLFTPAAGTYNPETGSGVPDPYGVAIGSINGRSRLYAGGELNGIAAMDAVFKTFVDPGSPNVAAPEPSNFLLAGLGVLLALAGTLRRFCIR